MISPPERRAGRTHTGRFPAVGRAAQTGLCVVVLLAVNLYIVRELFAIAYTRHMGSIEGAYIGLARQIGGHWGDLLWFPLWYNGIPFQNTYPPLLHIIVAAVAGATGISPALSYHAVTAAFYCLGPAALFWMAYRMSGRRLSSFAAALLYSLFSPSALLISGVRADVGGVFHARRLQALVGYGEGPHVTSLTLLPVAILCLDAALRKRCPAWYVLAALTSAAVVLTNWLGAFALAAAAVAYLLSHAAGGVRAWAAAAAVGLYAYVLASPWIPPSTIADIHRNAQRIGGPYHLTAAHLEYAALLLAALVLAHLWFERCKLAAHLRFALFFLIFMGTITLASAYRGVFLVPQSDRYHLEMEMALLLALAFALDPAWQRLRGHWRTAAALAFLLFCIFQVRAYRRYAAGLDRPIDIRTTSEYRTARWLDENTRGLRVMAAGSTGFWLNAFTEVPQFTGGFDQGISNPLLPDAIYQIYSGQGAGAREAEFALLWLEAFGVHAVVVTGPGSTEVYKPFAHPRKFEGHLKPLWRDGGDVVYEVPARSPSLAHVVPRASMVARTPAGGLEVDPLRPYVAALQDPALPAAGFRWESRRRASIEADLRAGDVLSVQITYHPGWHASVDGRRCFTYRDKLGLLAVETGCEGRCTVDLTYDGGLEMLLARVLSWAGLAGGLWWVVWKRSPAPAKNL